MNGIISELRVAQAKLESANKRVEELEKLCELFAQIHRNNERLGEQAQIMFRGLHEIEQIKGKPPIQVARTIASKTIGDVARHIAEHTLKDHEENTANNHAVLCGPETASGPAQHEAGDISSRASGPGTDGEQGPGS